MGNDGEYSNCENPRNGARNKIRIAMMIANLRRYTKKKLENVILLL